MFLVSVNTVHLNAFKIIETDFWKKYFWSQEVNRGHKIEKFGIIPKRTISKTYDDENVRFSKRTMTKTYDDGQKRTISHQNVRF